jgi:hypothetical protein
MDHFAGLGVSVKETSVCIVDDSGKIVREVTVASEARRFIVHSRSALGGQAAHTQRSTAHGGEHRHAAGPAAAMRGRKALSIVRF